MNVSYKPTRPEFNKSIKIIIIGIAIIGMIGFVMSVVIALIAGTPILP
jgi:protein translocase SEC61 complex gamma subunit